MDHDRIFKELLRTFFFEFLELFFPTLAARIDRSHDPTFLDKEDFGELPVDLRREMDLVARLRLAEGEAYFILHLEHEAQPSGEFPARMFRYFSRLWDRHGLPIYPIALFSYQGARLQPQQFSLRFHDLSVLDFRYRTVQLNQLNWRSYTDSKNPVASALMTRMKIRKSDRPRVKLQCLRLLVTLRLDRRKSGLIAHFVSSYLKLDGDEVRIYQRNLETLFQAERQEIMQYTNSWIEEGLEQGRVEGRVEALRESLAVLLVRLFGERAAQLVQRLPDLSVEALNDLQQQLKAGAELEQLMAS